MSCSLCFLFTYEKILSTFSTLVGFLKYFCKDKTFALYLNFCIFFYRVNSGTIFLGVCLLTMYSSSALSANSCIMNSLSITHERKAFADLLLNETNLIFMNLNFNQSYSDEFLEERKLERWVWVSNGSQYILSYPEDVNVFSFGLLKAKQDSINVEINIGNLTKSCKLQFNSYLAQYLSNIVKKNETTTDYRIDKSDGCICHSVIEKDDLGVYMYISDISAVKFGFPFRCYIGNKKNNIIEKSYVNYIVVTIIFFTYCFYPLAIEMAFFIEDRKMVQGSYYMSESPYSPSVFCKRMLFSGNSKHLAALRIIFLVIVLTSVIYKVKSEFHDCCNYALKSSNDNQSFQHAETIYIKYPEYLAWGIIHFVLVNICVLLNANGDLDDYIFFDLTNICNHGTVLKTVSVSVFSSNIEKQIQHDQIKKESQEEHQSKGQQDLEQQRRTKQQGEGRQGQEQKGQEQQGQKQQDQVEQQDQREQQSQGQHNLEHQGSQGQQGEGQQGPEQNGQVEQQDQKEHQSQGQQQSKHPKHLVSFKIRKIFLFFSYSFWTSFFCINSLNKNNTRYCNGCICTCIQSVICFPVNLALMIGSTFCPLVFNVYVFFVKYFIVFIGNVFYEKLSCNDNRVGKAEKKVLRFVLQSISHTLAILYLVLTYKHSFNIFFYGMSYVIQFFIFTLFLAVPHFTIQTYIYIIFFTSVVIYIFRFVNQFINLYKSLLEKILDIEQQNSIPIEHFDKVVANHFPLTNEIFYLFVKIMLSSLFFAIIYDTMRDVGYIRFGAQPDLTTVISLIFLFGPPRLVEGLLATDFTSRVHMKEKEIKEELKRIKASKHDKGLNSIKTMSIPQPVFTKEETNISCVNECIAWWRRVRPGNGVGKEENKTLREARCFCCNLLGMSCCRCCKSAFDDEENCKYCVKLTRTSKSKKISEKETSKSEEKTSTSEEKTTKNFTNNRRDYSPKCFCCRWLGMFFCGCCNFPLDDNGNCTCCVVLVTVFKSEEEPNTLRARSEYYQILKKNMTIHCVCIKDCLHKSETTEEENLLNELKTDTLYRITVDTVDEIGPRSVYKVKAEVLNDGMTELEAASNSDTSNKNKQLNENNSNKTNSEISDQTIKKGSESENDNKESEKIVNKSSEKGACAKPENKYTVRAIIESGAIKPEEIDDHLENKEPENQDNEKGKRKDSEDNKYTVEENIELEPLKTKL